MVRGSLCQGPRVDRAHASGWGRKTGAGHGRVSGRERPAGCCQDEGGAAGPGAQHPPSPACGPRGRGCPGPRPAPSPHLRRRPVPGFASELCDPQGLALRAPAPWPTVACARAPDTAPQAACSPGRPQRGAALAARAQAPRSAPAWSSACDRCFLPPHDASPRRLQIASDFTVFFP